MSLKIEKDGENGVKWSQELSILDLLYWFDATNDAKVEEAQSVDEYREFLKDKGYEGRDIMDILNDQYYDWEIITSIEKKNADGTYETVWKSTDDDKADLAGGAFATAEKRHIPRRKRSVFRKQRTAVLSFQRIFKRGQYSTAEQCDTGYRQAE